MTTGDEDSMKDAEFDALLQGRGDLADLLRAMPQPAPSAELDAAILAQAEQALNDDAQKAAETRPAANDATIPQAGRAPVSGFLMRWKVPLAFAASTFLAIHMINWDWLVAPAEQEAAEFSRPAAAPTAPAAPASRAVPPAAADQAAAAPAAEPAQAQAKAKSEAAPSENPAKSGTLSSPPNARPAKQPQAPMPEATAPDTAAVNAAPAGAAPAAAADAAAPAAQASTPAPAPARMRAPAPAAIPTPTQPASIGESAADRRAFADAKEESAAPAAGASAETRQKQMAKPMREGSRAAAIAPPTAPPPSSLSAAAGPANAAQPPEIWLKQIEQLLKAGSHKEALEQWQRFRQAYPNHPVDKELEKQLAALK